MRYTDTEQLCATPILQKPWRIYAEIPEHIESICCVERFHTRHISQCSVWRHQTSPGNHPNNAKSSKLTAYTAKTHMIRRNDHTSAEMPAAKCWYSNCDILSAVGRIQITISDDRCLVVTLSRYFLFTDVTR
ncbi:MAG: hypothetical protein KA368_00195 [Acidobacteria bacterium]|nr:hypothetical protein [Acidobacteriota bacterium]